MLAWRLSSIGQNPELTTVDKPLPNHEQEVVIDTTHSSLNHRDVWITAGKYPGITLPCTLGSDGAGRWENHRVLINPGIQWGNDEKVQSSDFNILGMPVDGTFAQQVKVLKNQVHPIPDHLSNEEASAIPLAGVTAYRALMVKCKPLPGQKVLITGIGGGVALWALQFALSVSCEVYVSSGSNDKINKAKKLGATNGVNSSESDWDKSLLSMSGGFDIIIDSIMGQTFPALIKLAKPGGQICFYGASAGNTENFQPHSVFWKQLSVYGSTMGSNADFLNMIQHIDKHKIFPVIDQVFSFKDLPKAMDRMRDRQQFGKIVLSHES